MPRALWVLTLAGLFSLTGNLDAREKGTVVAALDNEATEEASNDLAANMDGTPVTNARIEVNIPARQMTLFYEDEVVFKFPLAVGSPTYKTPVGPRAISQIIWNPWWIPPDSEWAKNDKPTPPGPGNPLGPVKMELGGTIRMHGTSNDSSVGHPVSHGCMRLHNEDAKTLAWWIQSHFTDKNDETLRDTYAEKSRQSFHVKLTRPLPVEIKYDLFEMGKDMFEIHPDFYGNAGNRFSKALDWLNEQGIDLGRVNTKALKKALGSSNRETVAIKMSQLLGGSSKDKDVALSEVE